MNQTKLESLIEALANMLIGLGVGFAAQLIVFPAVGLPPVALHQNVAISIAFTAVSLVRSYTLRRWFNAGLHQGAARLAARLLSWQ